MKKVILILMFLGPINSYSQNRTRIDSVFYLLDTVKTTVADRMWNFEKSSVYKNYTIQCPCLKSGGKPTFYYSIEGKDSGLLITQKELKAIKLIDLSTLILKSKSIDAIDRRDYAIFFIEPKGSKYIRHEMDFMNSNAKIVTVENTIKWKPDTSAFETKGLIRVNSKDLSKYYNKSVITSGNIVNRTVENNMVLLIMGTDYPNQDFMIMIQGDNINKFDPAFLYKGKKRFVKVTGKVIEYKGKPVIEISNENQIQQVWTR